MLRDRRHAVGAPIEPKPSLNLVDVIRALHYKTGGLLDSSHNHNLPHEKPVAAMRQVTNVIGWQSGIFTVPVEVLQSIAEYVDLSTLRLTCKAIEEAVFDVFAKHHLHNIECFVLDPRRLQRLRSILSNERLARKVRKIILSLDPFESKAAEHVLLAPRQQDYNQPKESEWHWLEQCHARKEHIRMRYNEHNQDLPSRRLLLMVLHDVAALHRVELALSLQPFYLVCSTCDNQTSISNEVVESLFSTVLQSTCRLSEFSVDSLSFSTLHYQHHRCSAGLKSFCENLKALSMAPLLEDLIVLFDSDQTLPTLHSDLPIPGLADFENLQSLCLETSSMLYYEPGSENSMLRYTSTMLATIQISSLRHLELVRVDITPFCLTDALQRCRLSLETLTLQDVHITSLDKHRIEILQQLLECPRLAKLTIYLLQEKDGYNATDFSSPCYCKGFHRTGAELLGRSNIKDALELNMLTEMSLEQQIV